MSRYVSWIRHYDNEYDETPSEWIKVRTYSSEEAANKAAIRLESRNMANGACCETKVLLEGVQP